MFLRSLRTGPVPGVFNPWFQRDPDHDLSPRGPGIRRRQFLEYLSQRRGRVRLLILGEALGYRGGHFSGIPMTSERILLGPGASAVARGFSFRRTSKEALAPPGFVEPTGTFVWGEIAKAGLDPYSVLIWNIFPWHPYDPKKGLLSNRTPGEEELALGLEPLRALAGMFKPRIILAVGKKAFAGVSKAGLGVPALELRHPANGGGGKFREGFREAARSMGLAGGSGSPESSVPTGRAAYRIS